MSSKPKMDLGLSDLDLDDIKPSAPKPRTPAEKREESAVVRSVSEEQGFAKTAMPFSAPRRRMNRHSGEQIHQISMKGPVSVLQRFIDYCDAQGLPYWQVIEKLMDESER
jgi:hypothetical protein